MTNRDRKKIARVVTKLRDAMSLLNEIYVCAPEGEGLEFRRLALEIRQAMQPLRGKSDEVVPAPAKTLFA